MPQRKAIFVANWKMYKTNGECISFIEKFLPQLKSDHEIVIAPPFVALEPMSKKLKGAKVALAAQNIFYEDEGAFTGEISPLMAKQFCKYAIIGHSERRHIFNETNYDVNKKVSKAFEHGLLPILCIGETLGQKNENKTEKILESQLLSALKNANKEKLSELVVAYEPVWAISKGKTDTKTKAATPEDAQAAHSFIRGLIKKNFGSNISESIRIAYGGSANTGNSGSLLSRKDVDGLLIGGASLDPEKFLQIIKSRR